MPTHTHPAARALVIVLAACLLLVGAPAAQEAPDLKAGTPVRFSPLVLDQHLPEPWYPRQLVVATVISSDADSVVIRLPRGGAHMSLPWESFSWIERGRSRTRVNVISITAGALGVGVPLGVFAAAIWEESICEYPMGPCRDNPHRSPAAQGVDWGIIGALVGGGLGYAISATGAFDGWKSVPLPARVDVARRRDRLAIAAGVPF